MKRPSRPITHPDLATALVDRDIGYRAGMREAALLWRAGLAYDRGAIAEGHRLCGLAYDATHGLLRTRRRRANPSSTAFSRS